MQFFLVMFVLQLLERYGRAGNLARLRYPNSTIILCVRLIEQLSNFRISRPSTSDELHFTENDVPRPMKSEINADASLLEKLRWVIK